MVLRHSAVKERENVCVCVGVWACVWVGACVGVWACGCISEWREFLSTPPTKFPATHLLSLTKTISRMTLNKQRHSDEFSSKYNWYFFLLNSHCQLKFYLTFLTLQVLMSVTTHLNLHIHRIQKVFQPDTNLFGCELGILLALIIVPWPCRRELPLPSSRELNSRP